eukprot:6635198-Pyramimonas_sp.AAC.1
MALARSTLTTRGADAVRPASGPWAENGEGLWTELRYESPPRRAGIDDKDTLIPLILKGRPVYACAA